MTVPWTTAEAGAWRSGYGAGPFTTDSGGGMNGYGVPQDYVGSLPVQPHPAFAQAQQARMASRAHYATDDTPLYSPAISESSSSIHPSRSARSSRQNSISGSSALAFTPSSSFSSVGANAHKPYARPTHAGKQKSMDRPPAVPGSLWAQYPPPVPKKQPPPSLPALRTSATLPPATQVSESPVDAFSADFTAPLKRARPSAPDLVGATSAVAAAFSAVSPSRDTPHLEQNSVETAEQLAADDPLATQLWKFFAKAKKQSMPHASRMENLAWRMGGLQLAKTKTETPVSTPAPIVQEQAEAVEVPEERGRTRRSVEPVIEEEGDEMDWRAKSRSRSRAVERVLDSTMDWRAASRSRSRARPPLSFDALRAPGQPAPPVLSSAAELFSLDAILAEAAASTATNEADILPSLPDVMAMPIMDDAVSRMFGFDSFASSGASSSAQPPALSSSSSTIRQAQPSSSATKRDRTMSPHRTYDDATRRRALGSVPGIVGEASLPVNQDPNYGFLPRLVRKTSFDGSSMASTAKPSPAFVQPASLDFPFADAASWARVLDPRGDQHDVTARASTSLEKAPQLYGLPINPAPQSQQPPAELAYPYAYHLANKSALPASAMPLPYPYAFPTDPAAYSASPFRSSYNGVMPPTIDPASWQANSSFVNPSAVMLKSAPPTAAPSPHTVPAMSRTEMSSGTPWTSMPPSPEGAGKGRGPVAAEVDAGGPTICTNCKTSNTPLWRRDDQGRPLCNGCGLFRKLHGVDRPLSLATGIVKKRNRNRPKDAPKKTTSASRAARRTSDQ